MNKSRSTGEFSKVRKLISVLGKCNGKAKIGDSEALISPAAAKVIAAVGLVILTGALALTAYIIEPVIAPYISLRDVVNSLMMILLLFSLIISIKNIVTVLYTADDLPVLLPMPFSAGQIVTAKLAVSLKFPVTLSLVIMNAVFLGLGFREGRGALFIIGTVLSSVLIPVTGLAVAVLFTVLIFRLFRFIRNRDVMVAIGGILTLVLTVAYLIVSSMLQKNDSANAALGALSTVAAVSDGFPNIAFMSKFMFGGNIAGLLISLAVTAAAIILALFVIKLFYLSTALSMQNTGSSDKPVTDSELGGIKKVGVRKALTAYESKNTRRNPAYMIYGFAMTFIWPLFFILPFALGNSAIFGEKKILFDTGSAQLIALLLGVTASCFACGFNILPVTAFSREGGSFGMLRTMPIDFKDYYKSKRNFSMLICSLGSVAYILILGIVCAVFGFVSLKDCWVFLYSACVCFLCNSIIINCMLVSNAKKPVFNWDSETEISRKLGMINLVAIVIGFIMYVALFAVLIISMAVDLSAASPGGVSLTVIAAVVIAVSAIIILAAAFAVDRSSVKKAQKSLAEFE